MESVWETRRNVAAGTAAAGRGAGRRVRPRDPASPVAPAPPAPARRASLRALGLRRSPISRPRSILISLFSSYFSSNTPFREAPFFLHLFLLFFSFLFSLSLAPCLYLDLTIHPLSSLFVSDTLCASLCLFLSGSFSVPLAMVLGWLKEMRLDLARSQVWEEGTWDIDSLLKRPSLCTRVSADESWQGKSGRTPKASGRSLGEAWPPRPGLSRKRETWRLPRVQNYFWLSFIQSLKGIPGPGPDGGLGTLMGNGLGLLAPSSLVLGTGLGEEGGWFKTKGFQVDGGRDLSCKDREVYAGRLSLRSWSPTVCSWLCHSLTTSDTSFLLFGHQCPYL